MTIKLRYILAVVAGLAAAPSFAQSFQNGSFENGSFSSTTVNHNVLPIGSTALTGWTVMGNAAGNVDWQKNGNEYGITSSDGSFSIDMTGSADVSGTSLRQVFDTLAGHTYALSFDIGNNSNYTFDSGAAIQAWIDGVLLTTGRNTNRTAGTNWLTTTAQFVAGGAATTLDLVEIDGGNYAGLDKVSVVDLGAPGAVPEPATWAMMLLGFGALGFTMRRRNVTARVSYAA